jgi:septum formation protein
MFPFVYLASQSPRRSQLLQQLGIEHQLLLPDATEDAEQLEIALHNEPALDYVQRVTLLKLEAAMKRLVLRSLVPAPVLCADTTVALDGVIYGKPQDADDAARMLQALSGRTHQVMTAIAIGSQQLRLTACSISQVTFAPVAAQEIEDYVASGEPMGKAGAYAIQGRAAAWISQIQGSYTGIMGLPLFETAALLKQLPYNPAISQPTPCNKKY